MKTYWLACRPYSLTASIVPVLLGTALAKLFFLAMPLDFRFWIKFTLVLLGCLTVQAVSNVVNDLVDFKTGLDSKENSTKFKALVSGALTWRQMFGLALGLCAVSGAIGLYFVWIIRGPLFAIVVMGGILALEYTAPPLKLKYRALGDLGVLLAFGLGMLFGTYIVMAHGQPGYLDRQWIFIVLCFGLPSASLVVAILQANNHRDRTGDREAGAKTLANSLSFKASKFLLNSLLVGPYIFVALASVALWFWIGPTALINLAPLLTVPSLLVLLRSIREDRYDRTVPNVARLHGQFGFLLTAGVVVQAIIESRKVFGA